MTAFRTVPYEASQSPHIPLSKNSEYLQLGHTYEAVMGLPLNPDMVAAKDDPIEPREPTVPIIKRFFTSL